VKTRNDAAPAATTKSEASANTVSREPGPVELFDPPMCCSTGLCGPTLDRSLLDVSEMVQSLKDDGIQVVRYQMASHPHMFLKYQDIMRMVREQGMQVFPVTVVAGRILKSGSYPTRREIDQALLQSTGAIK
jgi:hypothetical protein